MMRSRCISATTVILALAIALPSGATGQPDTLWTRAYDTDFWESCNRMLSIPDGGFAVGGESRPEGGLLSPWLMRVDSAGNVLWSQTYSSPYGSSSAEDLIQLDDGRFLLAGWEEHGSSWDIRLIMTDTSGQIEWQKSLGEENRSEFALDAACTDDGGYVLTGGWGTMDYERLLLMKTDSLGNVEWESHFDLNSQDIGYSVQQTSDGGYLLGGKTEYPGSDYDCVVVKADGSGEMEWSSVLDFGGDHTRVRMVHETSGGNYIGIAGEQGEYYTLIFKLDETGEPLWDTRIEVGESVDFVEMPDGGHLHAGFTAGKAGAVQDPASVMYDRRVTGNAPRRPCSHSDPGAAGRGDGSFIMRTDSLGNGIWDGVYQSPVYNNYASGHICTTSDGGSCLAAGVQQTGRQTTPAALDLWILRFGECTEVEEQQAPPGVALNCSCSPNPFGSLLEVRYQLREASDVNVRIRDLTGRLVCGERFHHQSRGEHTYIWTPNESLPAGCYTIVVEAESLRAAQRCVRVR